MTTSFALSGRSLRGAAVLVALSPAALLAQHQNGLLVGRVLSGDVAVPSATILVSDGRVTLARVDGRYRISLPEGRYAVRARRIGYTSSRDSVTIAAGVTSSVNFRLDHAAAALEAVAAVGTRGAERAAIDAMSPVEVIDGQQLRSTGRTESSRDLQAFASSINLSHETVGQGTDLVHALSMRGLSPDHVLVLVNGKRRHSSALVDLNRSLGRGSSGVDLNAIPASMIDHVEILHGDAVAQYGSDAIAGVINVVLRSGTHGYASSTAGVTASTYSDAVRVPSGGTPISASSSDGRTVQASIDKGVVFGDRGFLHGGFELRDRGATNRDVRGVPYSDPPIAEHYGDAHAHDLALVLNGGNAFANGVELYGNAGGASRTVGAPTFYTAASPGTLPVIAGDIDDYAGTVGVRGRTDDWRWDLSTVYGRNADGGYTLASVDGGSQRFSQSTTNLELMHEFPLFEELRVAIGGEYRRDGYGVEAGDAFGSLTQPAPGTGPGMATLTPLQATDRSRHMLGGYVDMEADLTSSLVLGLAGRSEHYNDVGTQNAGKVSLRFEPVRNYVMRGSVARGFRAPSLQQSSIGASYYEPSGGLVLVVPATGTLRAEHSNDYQLGVAAELTSALSFTLDGYRTDLDDRVVLSDVGGSVTQSLINGASTRTNGLDATLSYAMRFDNAATLRLTGGGNVNHTSIRSIAVTGQGAALSDFEQARLARGAPRDNVLAAAVFGLRDLGAMLRVQHFGEASEIGTSYAVIGAAWVTDASVSWTLLRRFTLTAGADNLFDVYPTANGFTSAPIISNAAPIVTPYPSGSPFGFNGRFIYGRLSLYL
jgi:iron complex outermembrane receptor protein